MHYVGLESLKQKEVDSFYKFSVDGTDLALKLYNIAYKRLFEFCISNNIPVHPNRMIIEPQIITKYKSKESIDIPDDIDVPSKIDDILEGEVID